MTTSRKAGSLRINRRALLQGLGASALLAPFLSSRRARSQPSGGQNLVIFHWPQGIERGWEPQVTGANPGDFTFSPIIASLEPFKSKLLILRGLQGCIKGILDAHNEGPFSLWTGSPYVANARPLLPSIDQVVAEELGGFAPYRSLHFGTQTVKSSTISNEFCFYSGTPGSPGIGVPPEDDPTVMYNQIFGALAGGVDQAQIDRVRAEKGSVLDFVSAQIPRVREQVGPSGYEKMDMHLEGIQSLERNLASLGSLQCRSNPAAPSLGGDVRNDHGLFPAVVDTQVDLLVSAIECGVTKVATLQLSNTDSQTMIPGVNPNLGIHAVVHGRPFAEKLPINTFFMQKLAYLLGKLESVVYDDGTTLLDHTLVVAGSEMAVGNHQNEPMVFFVAGGDQSYFRLGRYVDLEAGLPRTTKLLTSILHAMGLTHYPSYGNFTDDVSTGQLLEARG